MKIRVGYGFDVHQLVEGREFWLGGVRLEYHLGPLGHSDADVLLHAICDAVLGAANLGDIGTHFPDTDPQYKGADSRILLKDTMALVRAKGYELGNIDATVVLEKPKVNPHVDKIKQTIAGILEVDVDDVSIKATTNEKMGFIGREDGIAAHCVALIQKV